jgi:hypothetical protein
VLSSELAAHDQHHLLSPRLPSIIKALGDAQTRFVLAVRMIGFGAAWCDFIFFLCFSREEWDECNLRDVCWVAIGELLKNTTDADLPFVQLMLTHTLTMLNSSIEKPVCA